MAVPNVSEGRDAAVLGALAGALAPHGSAVRLLDTHTDADHHRSVFTLAGSPGALADALLALAREAVARIDVVSRQAGGHAAAGQHPHVGALDVVPLVYLREEERGAACAEALVVADRIGYELSVPVFLYGELSGGEAKPPVTRAQLRRGGLAGLGERMRTADAAEALLPDFGPHGIHPTAGATLVCARPPLVAFNLQLAPPATLQDAREIAASIREGAAHGLPGLRAIGVLLDGRVAQVSMNVERPFELALADVLAAVEEHHAVSSAELVGLAPVAALAGFPERVPIVGFDPARHIVENALVC